MPTKEQTDLADRQLVHRVAQDVSNWKFFYEAKKGTTINQLQEQIHTQADRRALMHLIQYNFLEINGGILDITHLGYCAIQEIEESHEDITYETKRRRTEERYFLGNKWEDEGRKTPCIHPT